MKRSLLLVVFIALGVLCSTERSWAVVDRSLDGDKKCTLCHNEASGHILSIYQTKHGVKGDTRTPGCQGCHGESVQHQQNPTESPEVVFGAKSKLLSSPEARTNACLSCHESSVHARTYWSGSAHERQGLTCTNCHEMHNPEQKVLNTEVGWARLRMRFL